MRFRRSDGSSNDLATAASSSAAAGGAAKKRSMTESVLFFFFVLTASFSAVATATAAAGDDGIAVGRKTTTTTTRTTTWMNVGGPDYEIANAPGFETDWILTDPSVMHFDAYSKPIRSRYSQVHWTNHGPIPLPDAVVERYAVATTTTTTTDTSTDNSTAGGSDVMAVVGYEVDQVRIDPITGEEVPVPITWAYNHHYMAFLLGATDAETATTMAEVPVTPAMRKAGMAHLGATTTTWLPRTVATPGKDRTDVDVDVDDEVPSWTFVSEGNGGEMRKSYHSYPRGYAQLVSRPRSFSITPMQIDTWNRDPAARNSSRFVPPPGPPDRYFPASTSRRVVDHLTEARYNPLLECPCTDRLKKERWMSYELRSIDRDDDRDRDEDLAVDDGSRLDNATECFEAADRLLPSGTGIVRRAIVPGSGPGICEALRTGDGGLEVTWDRGGDRDRRVDDDDDDLLVVGSTPLGSIVNVTVVLNATGRKAEITLKGPYLDDDDDDDDRWFAVGFGARSMCVRMDADECTTGGPYAIVVLPPSFDATTTTRKKKKKSEVVERKLDYHGAGRVLPPGLEVLSNAIERDDDDGRRRRVVRLRRPLEGPTGDDDGYYSFREAAEEGVAEIPVILATGCSGAVAFGRHCGHQSPDPMTLARVGVAREVVRDGIKGSIGGRPFEKDCLDEPRGDLVRQGNPTCDIRTYRGGLSCCVHGGYLLDSNQTVPWEDDDDDVLEYRLKFRFYHQDYRRRPAPPPSLEPAGTATAAAALRELEATTTTASHRNLIRVYWTTEAGAGEYDVPGCADPSRPSECVHTITSEWKVRESVDVSDAEGDARGVELIYAAPHCHAPTCLSMELYDADTGELLCGVEPTRGSGDDRTGYDEEGFLAIPPCLWSSPRDDENDDDGLRPPRFLPWNATLRSVKRANSTFPHTGEMASWQMRAVVVVPTGASADPRGPLRRRRRRRGG